MDGKSITKKDNCCSNANYYDMETSFDHMVQMVQKNHSQGGERISLSYWERIGSLKKDYDADNAKESSEMSNEDSCVRKPKKNTKTRP